MGNFRPKGSLVSLRRSRNSSIEEIFWLWVPTDTHVNYYCFERSFGMFGTFVYHLDVCGSFRLIAHIAGARRPPTRSPWRYDCSRVGMRDIPISQKYRGVKFCGVVKYRGILSASIVGKYGFNTAQFISLYAQPCAINLLFLLHLLRNECSHIHHKQHIQCTNILKATY